MPTPSALLQERLWWRALTAEFALPREQSYFQMRCGESPRLFSAKQTLWLAEIDRIQTFLDGTKISSRQMENCRVAAKGAIGELRAATLKTPGRPGGFLSLFFAANGGHAGLYSLIAYFAVKYLFLNAATVRKLYPGRHDGLSPWISDLLDNVLNEPVAADWELSHDELSSILMADWFLGLCEREAFDEIPALLAQLRAALVPARQMANALFDKNVVEELTTKSSRWNTVTSAFAESLRFRLHGERTIIRKRREAKAADNGGKIRGAARIASIRKTKGACS